ncbi:lipopolysaccharide heptosyltransferase II [Nitrospira sp. Kam-Ns4a]
MRGPNWIGDAVMCEPALAGLRELFPAAEIALLVKPAVAGLFEGHPAVDRILLYDGKGRHAGLSGKWALASSLRRMGFDLAVLFQNAFEAALIAFLAGIPRRYGYATDGRGWLLSEPVAMPDRGRAIHQVHYYLDLLRPLGGFLPARPPRLFVSEQDEREAGALLAAEVAPGDFLVGLNPGSTYGGAKRWLPERFAQAADRLLERLSVERGQPARLVIVGAPGEEPLAQAIADRMVARPVLLTGRTTVRQLMAVVKRCGLFLSNDTGPMHIAAAFGVPLVAIFGPTDPRTTAPYGTGHTIVRQPVECAPCLLRECPIDHRCMTGITVDMVSEAAVERLTRGREACGEGRAARPAPLAPLAGVTVFLDRDGTLNEDTGYVSTLEEFRLLPGAVEAVVRLKRAGARVVVVTNQSGVARGLISPEALEIIHAKLRAALQAGGASLDGLYVCPHHPDDGCGCRKPAPGLVNQAASDLGVDLSAAYVVGDQPRDIELARQVGARAVLVTSGPAGQAGLELPSAAKPDFVAPGLREAVEWIVADAARKGTGREARG